MRPYHYEHLGTSNGSARGGLRLGAVLSLRLARLGCNLNLLQSPDGSHMWSHLHRLAKNAAQ
jgi:hypothetical protein